MTGRERMLATLRFAEPDRPPHFETMFELAEEAFGRPFPAWHEWRDCTAPRKRELLAQCMGLYQQIVERYQWDALAVYFPWSDPDGVRAAKATFGDRILIGSIVGGCCWAIEAVHDWTEFAVTLAERPEELHAQVRAMRDQSCATIDRLADAGADFILLVNDIADNRGTFLRPAQMREFVLPYLAECVAHVRARGVLPFIHTDGNIMAILDEWIGLNAALYQSVDPMAGMDLAIVKPRCHGRLALMGNVQCSLLQDGPPEAIRAAAAYALRHGAPGGGYVFGSSNTIFKGLPLAHYETMLDVLRHWPGRS
jgi:uroporphyrinogen decarboxylase